MKITDVRTTLLTGPSTNDRFFREARRRRSAAFIEVETDAGITGIGETYAGYFCPEAVPAIVDFFRPVLIGEDPHNAGELWQRMYRCGQFWSRVGLGTSVLTGIDAALYDAAGKADGVPVWYLLGGCKHERLPAYATGGPSNFPLTKLAEKVDYYLSLGFSGLKLGAGACVAGEGWTISGDPNEAADMEAQKVSFIREHAGHGFHIMLDAHMDNSPGVTWGLETALCVARALEPFCLMFLEEPLPYTDPWAYAELARSTVVPVAGGECLTAVYEWKVFAERDCFDIGQPDASFTGGLGEFMKVAALLKARGRQIATHAWGAGGSLMQNVHCGFASGNTAILEVPPDYGPLHSEIIGESLRMKNGCVLPPETPGLGIVLSEETKRRYPFVPGSGEFNSVPGKILRD